MLGTSLIFWQTEIQPFTAATGVQVTPCACELKDGRTGYYLGFDWKQEIEAKGATVELITTDNLVQHDI